MSTAERLRQEGKAVGRVEGRIEGRVEALTRILSHRFGNLPVDATQRLATASLEQLDRWTERVLTARSLAEVFTVA